MVFKNSLEGNGVKKGKEGKDYWSVLCLIYDI